MNHFDVRLTATLVRLGLMQADFPYGMADWFLRGLDCVVSANISSPTIYNNCTFINCNIQNAMVDNSELSGCRFQGSSVQGCLINGALTVDGDLTLAGGTISGASSYLGEPDPIQVALSFRTDKKPKLPKKLEKGWKV